jgi:micrococcal nuclease
MIAARTQGGGRAPALLPLLVLLTACGGGEEGDDDDDCGPSSATVVEIIDGDTVVIEGGQRVRYLMVDTPEITGGHDDCFGDNAAQFNSDLVLARTVELAYDVECTDQFDRLLAYVSVDGIEVNSRLVERGYACVLHISPNGDDRVDEFEDLELAAKEGLRGMWNPDVCAEVTCE